MDPSRSSVRWPPAVASAVVLVMLGVCTAPAVALFVLADVHSGNVRELLTYAVPAVMGYPVAALLWFHTRRLGTAGRPAARAAGRAWILTVLGVALVVTVSIRPIAAAAHLCYLQWLEYQPGGRGYHP